MDRRDFVASTAAAAAALPLLRPLGPTPSVPQGTILPLTSTSDVFVPPRGRGFNKFSFDFPEPSVEFAGFRFGILVFTRENAYGLDASKIAVSQDGASLTLTANGLVWAGGQERSAGRVVVKLRKTDDAVLCDVTAEMGQPIKAVTVVLRGVPRGRISTGGESADARDNELLYGYPFGAGDLFGGNTAQGLSTPLTIVESGPQEFLALHSLDDTVRAKRFFFQPGETGYRVELVHEVEGWLKQPKVIVPTWRIGKATTLDAAAQPHYDHLERAYHLTRWDKRQDVPPWIRQTALVMTLHGMHYTGYVFNDYAKMLEQLRWTATLIPADRVLVFLSSWDGRYYWDYPAYRAAPRLGGETGLKRLVDEGHKLGFKFMPMFGANAANRHSPAYGPVASAATSKIDGDPFPLNWVDWDNDRHQEGWLSYMNLGVPAWRDHLSERIGDAIDRYNMDAYFLDIIAGWVNNPTADMHLGAKILVQGLKASYPNVLACGEFLYDALLEFIPLYHVLVPRAVPFARFFSHLSHPAPGRGSTGVHEAGFGRFDPATLSLTKREGLIPTLNVVDDTFTKYRDQMAAVIRQAKEWAG